MTHGEAPAEAWRPAFDALSAELRASFRAWERDPAPWPEARVSALARRAFRLQHAANGPYRSYCRRLGVGPDDAAGWRDLPPVPTAAFRRVDLCLGDPSEARAVFRTSGTSGGARHRGRHPVLDLSLYRASLEATFRRHVLGSPGEVPADPPRILSLIPPFRAAPDSSLSWMADAVLRRFGAPGSVVAADAEGVRWEEAGAAAEAAIEEGAPLLILATTLAADAWTRRLAESGARLVLPPGSALMDTGGAKGREGLRRGEVLAAVEARLGIPPAAVVNEFGMTELLSQRYSRPAAVAGPGGEGGDPERPRLYGPPWLRTRALDPVTLEELPEGEAGVLCHLDLANAGSVCAVLTEDMGRVRAGVVEWVGRASGAPPRGCSLATAELLAAQEG